MNTKTNMNDVMVKAENWMVEMLGKELAQKFAGCYTAIAAGEVLSRRGIPYRIAQNHFR